MDVGECGRLNFLVGLGTIGRGLMLIVVGDLRQVDYNVIIIYLSALELPSPWRHSQPHATVVWIMEQLSTSARDLREQIARAEAELKALKEQLVKVEGGGQVIDESVEVPTGAKRKWPLRAVEYERYGRQLILPSVGVEG